MAIRVLFRDSLAGGLPEDMGVAFRDPAEARAWAEASWADSTADGIPGDPELTWATEWLGTATYRTAVVSCAPVEAFVVQYQLYNFV